jgi:DNA-binding transcriptional ArsR family regulator
MSDTTLHLDAEALQVLAHPLRARLLSALRRGGPATATGLAQELGTNTGATSYHLRRMEAVGLVRDTGEGAGRRRLWTPATRLHDWTPSDLGADPGSRAALDWLEQFYAQDVADRSAAWHAARDRWPTPWWDVFGFSDDVVRLAPDRAHRLLEEIESLVARYQDEADGDGPGAEGSVVVSLHWGALPQDPEAVPGDGD